ncbi:MULTISPECIES: DNA recombination protein RmuC [unclassified Mesorhizobium]|uniref:DNA recombination protein RmuC n=1 Tax=unclassified Mesorhizobium TaxID=325217 RepID=UPI000BAEAF4D|nr:MULTISPECIES: DNA recombination protein RmuC [unclassified Mesorhizobium]TGT60499.1 DNA recombination protein RmuC [Mesorhizobium sp. M00.F.Ca.ET.170.01.1.1]AZO10398.1 DNA recombination protein RmuC [Mesorhizobium sp. M3A.F.Ca.ET.080.04.2.1]PBB87920.1 DNA recombination protein RmuC [Mesorhizobium sp. WSM3876]RWB73607.1 MAG: DNA recombination protein RmuC [Mesorhizobium sp.]RWB91836.1 MAG: DNA recombination protein RmuC [Mesorhizobium sp.]
MNDTTSIFSEPVARLGATTITLGQALFVGALLLLALFVALVVALWRAAGARAIAASEAADHARDTEARMADILQAQAEMQGRMGAIAEVFGARQAELTQSLGQRLDAMTGRLGQTMAEQTRSTHESLARLQERLAVIDTAQGNIQSLAGQVVQLQAILSNKQTRGAFGQSRMEAIIADGLPHGAYEFQASLSNGSRPDCLVRMPNGAPMLAIDAKFPLEAWNAIRAAEGADLQKSAAQAFRRDIEVHIRDIAEKYLIQGETQDTAFMFVPSESVFAEIHENFEAVVQKAHRARVVIVSPSLLMLSIQVIQAILKDARMREQAHLIQGEVIRLMEDVGRVDERVRRLQTHFGQAAKDIDDILVSTSKVTKRGQKIEALEFAEGETEPARGGPARIEPSARVADSKTGQLRLRVVEDSE